MKDVSDVRLLVSDYIELINGHVKKITDKKNLSLLWDRHLNGISICLYYEE